MTGWLYPAPTDDGGAEHLSPGLALPRVTLPSTFGHAIDLTQRPGRAVLFVYPWTGRPGLSNPPDWDHIAGAHGSTPEAEGFRDLYPVFRALGVEVIGLSGQDTAHQKELSGRLGLPFGILSDARFAFADALRLPRFSTGGENYLKRLTLLVKDGAIERVFYPVHPPDTHAADVLRTVTRA